MTPVLVLTTVGASFDARALARTLVEAKLAACVNIIDRVQSVYRWQGKVEEDAEQLLIIKTADARVEALREELFRLHPYDVP
jgi:periplasmic divalent cation tolerance protein